MGLKVHTNTDAPIETVVKATRQYLASLIADGYVITSVHVEAQVKSPLQEMVVSLKHQVES